MIVTIYDFDNTAVPVHIGNHYINHIHVDVVSGDEVVNITLDDGTVVNADSSDCRLFGFFDASYDVSTPEDIEKWLEFTGEKGHTYSYQRADMF